MSDSGRGTNVGMVPLGDVSSIFGGLGTMDGCCAVASWWSAGTMSNIGATLALVSLKVPAEESGGSLG